MNLQRTLSAVAIVFALVAGGYALRRAKASPRPTANVAAQQAGSAGANDPKVIRFVKNPEVAPALAARDITGKAVSVASLKGKVVVVNFWATWCPPCREEIPEMIALQNKYKDRLQIVGVSEDEDGPEKVQRFAQQVGMNYPIVMATTEIVGAWGGVPALPTSFVIDTQGRVVTKHMGLFDANVYDREIRSLLGMPVDAQVQTFVDQGQVFMKNAANATDLPGVSFDGLTPAQKAAALRRLNSEACTCGCKMTLAQCRINDEACPISKAAANEVVKEIRAGTPAATPAPKT